MQNTREWVCYLLWMLKMLNTRTHFFLFKFSEYIIILVAGLKGSRYLVPCDRTYHCHNFLCSPPPHNQLAWENPVKVNPASMHLLHLCPSASLGWLTVEHIRGARGRTSIDQVCFVLFSCGLHIQTMVTLRSCCTVNKRMKKRSKLVLCLLLVPWQLQVELDTNSLCGCF